MSGATTPADGTATDQAANGSTGGRMPAIYLSHGAPPLADDTLWTRQLADWSADLPRPASVLMVSAHWEAAPLMLSAPGARTPLVYDFGGFQQRYYTLTYPTPDASWLAREVSSLMPSAAPVGSFMKTANGMWASSYAPEK